MKTYQDFLENRRQLSQEDGFDPIFMPEWLFDFQKHLVEWAIRKGRAAIFADCGLGKTPMQLVWAENVVRKTNKPVLILTPLAVSYQTVKEAEKFHIKAERSSDGKYNSTIVVTNYQRLHHFDCTKFGGVVSDESSILKNATGSTRTAITEFMRKIQYRLLCTATAAPNDFHELGTSSEALGYLGFQDMLSKFFKQDMKKDYLGWGRTGYRFRGHAELPFWRWVCSWARVCRRPSDLGFNDGAFVLSSLREHEHVIENSKLRSGMLFPVSAITLSEQREERRITIPGRCDAAAEYAANNGATVLWCHLNEEANYLEKIIPDSLQVSGSMPDEKKEERLLAFQSGELKTLITKPKIGCFGLNWQHCHNVVTFPSHSWEQYYQAVRRCWRFGQTKEVDVQIVTTKGEQRVLKNLQRKAKQADEMFDKLTRYANDALHIESRDDFNQKEEVPKWL